jgi:hypothetical protein
LFDFHLVATHLRRFLQVPRLLLALEVEHEVVGGVGDGEAEVVDVPLDVVVVLLERFVLEAEVRGLELPVFVYEGELIRAEQRRRP